MQLNDIIQVKGCITQDYFTKGSSLSQLESILGFETGRMAKGMMVAALTELPALHQFELLGYSQVAGDKFGPHATDGLDVKKLNEMVLREGSFLFGPKRLVIVIANQPHNDQLDNDTKYPPGQDVPQWKVTSPLPAKVMAQVLPGTVCQHLNWLATSTIIQSVADGRQQF